ncbi:Ribosomal large subunit pseudouridine synthase A [Corynebacterium urogenitale]|uniref:RNA pseudouridylate synthase n=1 Tax=Corynebacterium urogenitale TaxID=2487892 RepID=A0A5J6Z6V8_9CORY|nr:Ribosomal large subunit pseudouridine synthase A [Corynebacterium urogenitale]
MSLTRWSPQPIDGISAQRVVLRGEVPSDGRNYVAAAAGDSPFAPGEPLVPGSILERPVPAWFHPETGPEPPHLLGMPIPILVSTPDLLVVDKPHGLPSTPNGALLRATAQTMLRVRRHEPELTAAHRLDRLTGGLLLFVRRPQARGFFQTQFQGHTVRKTYEAVTAVRDVDTVLRTSVAAELGATVASGKRTRIDLRMRKIRHDPQVHVTGTTEPGKPTVTWVTRIGERSFRLEPTTGHTHQLRVLMNHLGLPIAGDDTYPHYRPHNLWDPDTEKLQLRAVQLELDVLEGKRRVFRAPSLGMEPTR